MENYGVQPHQNLYQGLVRRGDSVKVSLEISVVSFGKKYFILFIYCMSELSKRREIKIQK